IEIFGGVDNRDESLWQSQEVPLNEVAVLKRRADSFVVSKLEVLDLIQSKEGGGGMQMHVLREPVDVDQLVSSAEPMAKRMRVFDLAVLLEMIDKMADHHLRATLRFQCRFDGFKVVVSQSVIRISECHPLSPHDVESKVSGR